MTLDADRRAQIVERLTRRIAELGLIAPAILFLEASKPLAFIGAQVLWTAQPFLNGAFHPNDVRDFAELLQDETGAEALIAQLEAARPIDRA